MKDLKKFISHETERIIWYSTVIARFEGDQENQTSPYKKPT